MWWGMFSDPETFKKHMEESLEVERAEQERRRKEEEDMWDPGGVNRKKIREAEDRFCEAIRERKRKEKEEKRKRMFPTPWEKDL